MNKNIGLWLLAPPALQAQGIEEVRSDVMNIANRLAEEVDPNLGLFINQVTGQYEVRYENPKTGVSALVCQVEPGDLDGRLINNLKALDMWRNDLNAKQWRAESEAEAAKQEAKRKAETEELYKELQEELEGRLSEKQSLQNMINKTRGISVPRSVGKDKE
jgi:hypothetical protein